MHQLTAPRLFLRPAWLGASLLLLTLAFALSACTHPIEGCTAAVPSDPSLEVANGVAYIGVGTSVAAVRTTDGSQLWQTTVGGDTSFATLANGVLYVGSGATLAALRESSGKQLWQFQGKGYSAFINRYLGWSDGTNPIVAGGIVYVASSVAVYAVRESSGQLLWQYVTGGTTPTMLVLDNTTLYAGTSGSLAALRASDGKLLWKSQQNPRFFSVLGSEIYISENTTVTALSKSDGQPLWSFPLTSTTSDTTVTPTAAGTVYINALDTLYALRETDGKLLWSFPADGFVKPMIVNNVLYTLSGDGHATALNATTGALIWQSPNRIYESIVDTSSGAIYTQGFDAKTQHYTSLALKTSDGSVLWVSSDVYAVPRLVTNGVVYFATSSGGCSSPAARVAYAVRAHDGSDLWHFPL